MSRRTRLGFLAACLLAFALIAALTTWGTPRGRPARPAWPVTDLHDIEQLQARFNADQGMPRLVLALAPT
jgi:hypothetical protein